MTYKLCQNANFKNGGTTIQMGTLHELLNMLSLSLMSRVHATPGYLEVQKVQSRRFTFGRKLMKCRWPVRTFG